MCLQVRKLLRDFGREVRLESMFQHDLSCGCLQVKMSRATVVHRPPRHGKTSSPRKPTTRGCSPASSFQTDVWIEHAVRSGKKNVRLPMLEVLARGFRVSRIEIRLEILIRTPGRTDYATIKKSACQSSP